MATLTLKVDGTFSEVSFYPDDTIGRVRELVAIAQNSHPDRMFLQVLVTLPDGYYSTPKEWSDLFLRLSRDGQTVSEEVFRIYTTEIRPSLSSIAVRSFTREQWDEVSPKDEIRRDGGQEWHILGAKVQTVLPLPPKDVALPTNVIPLLSVSSLYETIHTMPVTQLRVTLLPSDPSDAVLRAYFPRFRPETPPNLDASKDSILASEALLGKLLALPIKTHKKPYSLTKAKWIVPLNATTFGSPRMQFEQIFYGLTVSEETPYIAYYTAESAALRSKFYVKDPKTKIPVLDTSLLRAWYDETKPSRRRPTLLLYKGSSRGTFQRIAITSIDIALEVRKERGSKADLKSMRAESLKWLQSLDAVMPFLDERDLTEDRWELTDMSLTAKYATEETEFDLLRFPCLQSIFGEEGGTFRLLRTEQGAETVSRRIVDACQALNREGAVPTAEYLAEELMTSPEDATTLLEEIASGDINCDRVLRDYPTIRFDRDEVEIKFATNPDRILRYADLLRYVLTTDSSEVNAVCPRRKEAVAALSATPQAAAPVEEEEIDESLFELLGMSPEPAATAAAPPPEPVKRSRKVKVAEAKTNTSSYFNDRLKTFNAELFAPPYSKECEKSNQVVVLTPADQEAIRSDPAKGPAYTYETAPPNERLDIPGGTAICPPYWCMTDLIPLREDQLVKGDDGQMECPVCHGKVRPNDTVSTKEYPVIKRVTSKGKRSKFPKFMKNRTGVPCCAPTPGRTTAPLEETEASKRDQRELYVLSEDVQEVPEFRVAQISPELAAQIGVSTSYDKTLDRSRMKPGSTDTFRVGLGRPSKTIRRFLPDYRTEITGTDEEALRQCSFLASSTAADPIQEFREAFDAGTVDPLNELEYVSHVVRFSVLLVATGTGVVRCGFRTSGKGYGRGRTLVVFLSEASRSLTLLARVTRREDLSQTDYKADIQDPSTPFRDQLVNLLALENEACAGDLPSAALAADALETIRTSIVRTGLTVTDAIIDASGQSQAYLVQWTDGETHSFLLPFRATAETPVGGTFRKRAYHEVAVSELPRYDDQVRILKDLGAITRFAGYAPAAGMDHRNASGQIVELETESGFRLPVQPTEPSPGPVTEVLETIRTATGTTETGQEVKGDTVLLKAREDREGRSVKSFVDYRAEVLEFLLMSLARDLQTSEYAALRTLLKSPTLDESALLPRLTEWYTAESYADDTSSSYKLLSKVRTPCGQLKDEPTCNAASLCGWTKGPKPCKVRVRSSIIKQEELLTRLATVLVENDKQRALVLDNRVSPFFSTVLYLEMPHEWITTSY